MLRKLLHAGSPLVITLVLALSSIVQEQQPKESAIRPSSNPDPHANQGVKETTLGSLPANILNAELKSARGGSFTLSDYPGKVIVVNFWATWCGPCVFATPTFVTLQSKFRSRGVSIIELSTEDPEVSARNVRHWIRINKVNYRVGWATKEVASGLMQNNGNIPQTFVIGRDRRILKRFIGFNKVQTPRLMKQAIEEALNQP